MKILHWMKRENSGLARSTIEVAAYEEKAGHEVAVRQPGDDGLLYGRMTNPDIHCIHSQLGIKTYHDGVPKIMWMHGEPISSVGNGVSMKAIVDLAPVVDAFICMRKEELAIWDSIKRTYLVPKGIDLEIYKPLPGPGLERLSGEPAVLYVENWRGQRNPLYLCVAMQEVWRKLPNARLHLFNCPGGKMQETFMALAKNNKWWPFLRTVSGPVPDVNQLYNKADMVVSCLHPLYARGIEAFGAGKAFIGSGYREPGYPWTCELDPLDMARAIIECWEGYDKIDYRKWAEDRHDVKETVRQAVEIYGRYVA
jgi:glycosyltransferase involved in cell wall biosynthesis